MAQSQPNIFLFYGDDNYSSYQKLTLWKNEFIRKYGDETNLEVVDGEKLDPSEFITNLEAMPFLAEKRMIIVKDFLKNGSAEDQRRVADALENTPDFLVLIFHESETPDRRTSLFQKINKQGKAIEFSTLSLAETLSWITEYAKQRNITITQQTASFLIEYCGLNLWHLSGELNKLKDYTRGRQITRKDIEDACVPSITSSIFKLTDAIATKNTKESLKVLHTLLASGEEIQHIFFMVVRHFRILIQTKDLLEKRESLPEITRRLKQHPFVIKTTSKQAGNFDNGKLKAIYGEFLKIDIAAKTGGIKSYQGDTKEFELALERLIIDYCR